MSDVKGAWIDTTTYGDDLNHKSLPEKDGIVLCIFNKTPEDGEAIILNSAEPLKDRMKSTETGPTTFFTGLR